MFLEFHHFFFNVNYIFNYSMKLNSPLFPIYIHLSFTTFFLLNRYASVTILYSQSYLMVFLLPWRKWSFHDNMYSTRIFFVVNNIWNMCIEIEYWINLPWLFALLITACRPIAQARKTHEKKTICYPKSWIDAFHTDLNHFNL